MKVSPAQFTTLYQNPHRTQMSMSIYQPTNMLTAVIANTGTLSKGSMIIPYTTLSGSYLNIPQNATLLVGSAYGLQDYGKVRIKSADFANLYVAENSDVLWPTGTPYIVSSILNFNGVSGSHLFTDLTGKLWTAGGNSVISSAQSEFGGTSAYFDGTDRKSVV